VLDRQVSAQGDAMVHDAERSVSASAGASGATPAPRPQLPAVRRIDPGAPARWLALGLRDLRQTGGRGLFYGAVFVLMGELIGLVYATRWQLTMGLTAGFFLMGPFVCVGIQDLSRQRERGLAPTLAASLVCWLRNLGSIAFFAAILTFAMVVWARISVVVFALFSTTDFPDLKGIVSQIAQMANLEFLLVWMAIGLLFATLVFAISVVSMPLMLDRRADTMTAIFASARTLAANPLPMALWAALIVTLIGASLVFWLGLLLVTAPLVGHASWHAYRALLEPADMAAGQ
jgi:uncharacterized membrane protein